MEFHVRFRGIYGPEIRGDTCVTLLHRVIEWITKGVSYEADQRHADLIVKMMHLESESKPLGSRVEAKYPRGRS